MKAALKVFIIIAICCVLAGSLIFSIAGASIDFDFNKVEMEKANYQIVTKDYDVAEFAELNLTTQGVNVQFEKSTDEKIHLSFYESDIFENNFVQSKNTISLDRKSERWFTLFSFSGEKNKLTISLPANYDPKMNLRIANGSTDIVGFNFTKDVILEINNGTVELESSVFEGKTDFTLKNGAINVDKTTFGADSKFDLGNSMSKFENVEFGGTTSFDSKNGVMHFHEVTFSTISIKSSNGTLNFDDVTGDVFDLNLLNTSARGSIVGLETDYTVAISLRNSVSNLQNRAGADVNKKFTADVDNGTIKINFIR